MKISDYANHLLTVPSLLGEPPLLPIPINSSPSLVTPNLANPWQNVKIYQSKEAPLDLVANGWRFGIAVGKGDAAAFFVNFFDEDGNFVTGL